MSTLLGLAALLLLVAVIVLSGRSRKASEEAARTREELEQLRTSARAEQENLAAKLSQAQQAIQRLAKWEGIADADERATSILSAAKTELERATGEAAKLVADAKAQSDADTSESRRQARALREQAQATLDSATSRASAIVQAAQVKAEEIAGSAYEALKNASLYEQTVAAMKNIIEGYGDKYLIPERSLLDDLAEEFGHREGGEKLKEARAHSATMVRLGTAAACDYVEQGRKDTAVRFVIDAFNGKVDSILSRVKHDNAGTLGQEIRDAYTLVNFNGKAFRNARIAEAYLDARLDELKWASVTQQLKNDEREEQRRIKEQIREEEKARREYERALRESAKEQEVLQRAMEKARLLFDQASAEQKSKYELQLQELAAKLKEAEERNQRAISMAEQTKRGHVYIISNVGSFGEHVYKIGLTRRLEPIDRIRELGDASVPFEFDVHALIFSEDAPGLETQLQRHFLLMQMNKVNYRKEFFRVDIGHIREEVEKLGLSAKWTMTAEAREYRESMAIDQIITADPQKREAWMNRQWQMVRAETAAEALDEATV